MLKGVEIYTKGQGKQTWWLRFADHRGVVRALSSRTRDRRSAEWFGTTVSRILGAKTANAPLPPDVVEWLGRGMLDYHRRKLLEWGLLDRQAAAVNVRLPEHLDAWLESLRNGGVTEQHARESHAMACRLLVEACGCEYFDQVNAEAVKAQLAAWRRGGRVRRPGKPPKRVSVRTANHYTVKIKAFARWMTRPSVGRAYVNPLADLPTQAVEAHRVYQRHALAAAEAVQLLRSTEAAGPRYRLPGPERALVYWLVMETGLRASEALSLRRSSFDLDGKPATVTVAASKSKRRREDVLLLRPAIVEALRAHLALLAPDAVAFRLPSLQHLAKMVRADVAAAGIPLRPGRQVDFHALRHTFITALARGKVHPKLAQAAARHSDIRLTMQVYTHLEREDEAGALAALPDLAPPPAKDRHA